MTTNRSTGHEDADALNSAAEMLRAALACIESAHAGLESTFGALHQTLPDLERLGDDVDVVLAKIDRELRDLRRPTVVPIRQVRP